MKTKVPNFLKYLLVVVVWLQVGQIFSQASIKYTYVDTVNKEVVISNLGNQSQDISSYWFCLGSLGYLQISESIEAAGFTADAGILEPGESILLGFSALSEVSGGLALFTEESFGSSNPNILLDFVQWGRADNQRTSQSVNAGRWNDASAFLTVESPYVTSTGGGEVSAWSTCDVDAGSITIDRTSVNSSTLVNEGDVSATICIDGAPDPIAINVSGGVSGTEAGWMITDTASGEILALPAAGPFNLDGAGTGLCNIYRIVQNGPVAGKVVGGNMSDIGGCFDLSNPVTVLRAAPNAGVVSIDAGATSAANSSTLVNGDTAIICIDSDGAPITVVREGEEENLSYRYVITDDANNILNITNSNAIDLTGAGVGVCRIWGWSYRGVADNGAGFIGGPLADLEAANCSDISDNFVTAIRVVPEAGTVSVNAEATSAANSSTLVDGNTVTVCIDSEGAPITVVRAGEEENLSYRYVITDDANNILNITNSNAIDLTGAGAGTCRIWGWSYRGVADNGAGFIGGPLADLEAANCSDISDNFVTAIRVAPEAGTISVNADATSAANPSTLVDGNTVTVCIDSEGAPITVVREGEEENLSYRYVITDDANNILNITNSNAIDLTGAGAGTCRIWGWSYRGVADNGAGFIGGPLADLEAANCSDISDNFVTAIRVVPEAGTVSIDATTTTDANPSTLVEGNVATICIDSEGAPITVVRAGEEENLSYRYVITDDANNILNITNSNAIDLTGAGVGVCRIWGWSYRGVADNGAGFIGGPLADLEAANCSDISDNFVTAIRVAPEAGTVSVNADATSAANSSTLVDGNTVTVCIDSEGAPITVVREGEEENLSYRYVITDDANNILNITNSNAIDLTGAGAGTCRIWGWSYRGVADNGAGFIGGPLADLEAANCSDISDNFVTAIRVAPEAGTISVNADATSAANPSTLVDGNTVTVCIDSEGAPITVVREGEEENLSYRYVITDDANNILNITNSSAIDLTGAGAGVCRIWGWSYRGVADNGAGFIGGPLADLEAANCSDISDNFVTAIRVVPEAGTVSIDAEANSTLSIEGNTATVCIDNGDVLSIVVTKTGQETNLSYRYVITDNTEANNILAITNTRAIDFSSYGPGTCRIWGWSYRGTPDNGAGFIGGPLADLEAENCSDISDNWVTLVRLNGADCNVLSTDQFENVSLSIYPNPVSNVINLRADNLSSYNNLTVEVYSVRGKKVVSQRIDASNTSVSLQGVSDGLYLVNLIDSEKGLLSSKKIIKRQ